MPTFQFEAMDSTGAEIKDVIEAATEEDAQATIRQMGYFVTKITVKKSRKKAESAAGAKKKRGFVFGGVRSKDLTAFTRQLSILQDAGLPILRSLRILAGQAKAGRLKYSLEDTCDEIEAGSTLSEAMAKSPKCFNRLYVNMIKAGEAGGALELILQRLADFQERSESLKRKVKGAMIYPIVVMTVAVGILTFIMIKIVPEFEKIFEDFDLELPTMTLAAGDDLATGRVNYWYLIPGIPITIWLTIKLIRKFKHGRIGWDQFIIKVPIFGQLVEKNILARTTRTLGTLVASGVPILEALNITRDTSGNAIFEHMYQKVSEAIREGEAIAKPMKENSDSRLPSGGGVLLVLLHRRPDRAADLPLEIQATHRRRHRGQHGRRRRGNGRARHDALQSGRHLRRRSRRAHRQPHQADGTAVDHVPRRHGRLHRDRPVHSAGEADRRTQRVEEEAISG